VGVRERERVLDWMGCREFLLGTRSYLGPTTFGQADNVFHVPLHVHIQTYILQIRVSVCVRENSEICCCILCACSAGSVLRSCVTFCATN